MKKLILTFCSVALVAGSASATWYVKDYNTKTVTNELGITFTVAWPAGRPTMSVNQVITLNGQTCVDLSEPCAPGCPPIVGIENNFGFQNQSTLKEVIFPTTMTTIGASVFRGTSITNLDFSQTKVTSLGASCCQGLTTLTDVKLPPTLQTIFGNAFYGCTSLTNMAPLFPSTLINGGIGSDAFYNCALSADVKLNCPDLTYLTGRAFRNSKITSVDMSGSGILTLGSNNGDCFQNCTQLTNAVLPSCLRNIMGNTFNGCTALKTVTPFLPESVKTVGTSAFYNAPVEGELVIANAEFASLEGSAFRGTAISSARLGDTNDLYVGQYCLYQSTKLTNVVFTSGAVTFDPNNTQWCMNSSKLTAIYFRGAPPKNFGGYELPYNVSDKLRVYAPKGDADWDAFLTTNTVKTVSWRSAPLTAKQKTTFQTLYPGEKVPKLSASATNSDYTFFVCRWWPNGAPGLMIIVR